MKLDKSLSWVDDNLGWNNFDTGFCNRVVNWEVAYYIKDKLNEQHQIVLDRYCWPEVEDFIFLPNTSLKSNLKHICEVSRTKLLDKELVFNLNNKNHYLPKEDHLYYVFD